MIVTVRSNSSTAEPAPSTMGRVCALGATAATLGGSCDKGAHVLVRGRERVPIKSSGGRWGFG